jgi:hypothetical protein
MGSQLWGWVAKLDTLSSLLSHVFERLSAISGLLDNPLQLAKGVFCLSGFYLFLVLWKRIERLRVTPISEKSPRRKSFDRQSTQFAAFALVASFLVIFVFPSPLSDPEEPNFRRVDRKAVEKKKDPKANAPIVPGQRICADECGFGGPSIDPKREPDKVNRNDLADYWESLKTLPNTVSTFCTVTAKATSKTLFDYEIRMPSGGRCQRYFESSAASTEMRLLTPQSINGSVDVKSRSVTYASRSGFHGHDFFIASRCVLTEDMLESCTTLRYAVEVE